jgi:hypothetical protein
MEKNYILIAIKNILFRMPNIKRQLSLIFAFIFFVGIFSSAVAQTDTPSHSKPVNISNSGSTSDPRIVVDSDDGIHIIWKDVYTGMNYLYGKNNQWASPMQVKFPFDNQKPYLFAGKNTYIYALWITERGELYISSAKAAGFGNAKQWDKSVFISNSVVSFDLKVDEKGYLNLVYLCNADNPGSPAGIYYRNSSVNGSMWTNPKLIYQSNYFRSLDALTSNVNISTAEGAQATKVFIVWDNPLRKQVLFARSVDGGNKWDNPIEIDKPEEVTETMWPFHIRIGSYKDNVLLIWQNGDPNTSCTQYYQVSQDGGNTWSGQRSMLKSMSGCAQSNQIVAALENQFILESRINDQIFFSVLLDNDWSPPQLQDIPGAFTDPDTSSIVNYGCIQTALLGGIERLLVVGCDTNYGQNLNPAVPPSSNDQSKGDIWFVSRFLGSPKDWLSKLPAWSTPKIIANNSNNISNPALFLNNENIPQAFWLQPNDQKGPTQGINSEVSQSVFYSRLIGGNWTSPIQVIKSTVGEIHDPCFTMDANGRILAVWIGSDSGDFYFSQANLDQADSASNWSSPQKLPINSVIASSPKIVADQAGTYYLVYIIPLNEERGLYLIKSKDSGRTWSQPIKLFDGVSAGWEMVDQPKVTLSEDGALHVLWMRSTIPTKSGAQAVYYIRSNNEGDTWSQVQEVFDQPAKWADIVGTKGGTVIRMWQDDTSGRSILWYQYSIDNGISWSRSSSLASFGNRLESVSLTTNNSERPNLIIIDNRGVGTFSLQHYVWQDQSWNKYEGIDLDINSIQNKSDISTIMSSTGNLTVLYSVKVMLKKTNEIQSELYFTTRDLTIPSIVPANASATSVPVRMTGTPPTLLSPTAEIVPTAADNFNTNSQAGSSPNLWIDLVLGSGVAVLIVSVILVMVVRKKNAKY